MADSPVTCANCNQPIAENQPSISAKNGIRTQDFFHSDASGCAEASAVRPIVRKHRVSGQGKVGYKPPTNARNKD